jgi:hypothetical protein
VITRTLDGISGTLPAVQPAPALRPKTLGRVASAIAGERASKPSIDANPILARIAPPSRAVNPLWRAGAIGGIAAAMIFGFTTLLLQRDFAQLDSAINTNQLATLFKDFGPGFEESFYSPASRFVQFRGADGNGLALAILGEDRRAGRLFCRDLPANPSGRYQLATVDGNGKITRSVVTFTATNQRVLQVLENLPTLGADERLAILPAGEGAAVLLMAVSM